MKRFAQIAVIVLVCLLMFSGVKAGMVKQAVALDDPVDPLACWITTGAISGEKNLKDHFTGHVMPTVTDNTGPAMGCWSHRTASGDVFVGNVWFLTCIRDGGDPAGSPDVYANLAIMAANGTWNGVSGYAAQLEVWDHGESSYYPDEYALSISDPNGAFVYAVPKSLIVNGNVQIHPLTDPGPEGLGSCGE